jgi:hypothetical protein
MIGSIFAVVLVTVCVFYFIMAASPLLPNAALATLAENLNKVALGILGVALLAILAIIIHRMNH